MGREKKFGGRPGRKPKPGERVHLGFRVTPELKNRLESVAKANGRSQSQEAELRLERSFDREDLLVEVLTLAYGPELAGILMMIGWTMHDVGRAAGFIETRTLEGANDWTSQPYAFDQALQCANVLLKKARPAGDIGVPQSVTDDEIRDTYQVLGVAYANGMIDTLSGFHALSVEYKERAGKIIPLLGPIAKRISAGRKRGKSRSVSVAIKPKEAK